MEKPKIPFHVMLLYIYARFFPINKGKARISNFFFRKPNELLKNIFISSKDGRKFRTDLNDLTYRELFLDGYYEKKESLTLEQFVHKGDTVMDIGANFGWYTTLLAKLVGETGQVHSFEPVPWIYEELSYNTRLNDLLKDNVFLNNCALGADEGKAKINVFKNLPHGHASMSTKGKDNYESFECDIKTLDKYILENAISKVDFIKCDVEGAEMAVLQGGKNLFSQTKPPLMLIELNKETAREFGYKPEDLLLKLLEYHKYTFYKIVKERSLEKIEHIKVLNKDGNVICVSEC